MKASERGDFALGFRIPRITRKVGGRIVEDELIPLGQERESFEMDDLLAGVTRDDLDGPMSGFMREMSKRGSAGAGPDVGEKPMHRDRSYDQIGGQDAPDQLRDIVGNDSSMDLLGQPAGKPYGRGVPRDEYADIIEPRRDNTRKHSPDEFVDDDYADMAVFDSLSVPARSNRPVFAKAISEDETIDRTGGSDLVRLFRGR